MSSDFQELVRRLSVREREVLGHLADGHTYAAIARRMRLSPHTVDTYVRRIRAKTGAHNRTDLLVLALSAAGFELPAARGPAGAVRWFPAAGAHPADDIPA
ncbi:helix-turn-helix transcriptional regulator [Streptomyces sp. PTM05]|uniref:Helix-turn-helix transcriptional regulator n=1 Tax=Streptantibioticus parmotrematis TaxID=2873249 RepID=A0ABS7QRD1_9ACTN|nr:helix-turn-helix transcriptional regulator [Streptantibioticus parmotrematis]MBY8885229.1 helix-turn-helix transcriptional regulator [Streptantibioticus parmotrematis]